MKDFTEVTLLELVLLQLVAKGEGKWGWYELASALSRRDVPREPDMMVVLKKLAADGLLKRYVEPGSPRDRWELTPAGASILNTKPSANTAESALAGVLDAIGKEANAPLHGSGSLQ